MSGWVKWEKDLETAPPFKRLTRRLKEVIHAKVRNDVTQDGNASVLGALHDAAIVSLAMGCLLRMWAYADTHIRADDTLDLGPEDVDDLVGVPGFASCLPEDWLIPIDEGNVELPFFQQHNGVAAKRAAMSQKRMERKRSKDKATPVSNERNNSVTGASPDQTRPDQTRPDQEELHKARARAAVELVPRETEDDPLAFERVRCSYPKFGGNQRAWLLAERNCRRLIESGETWESLEAASERYALYVKAGGVSSPQFVTTPDKFFDPANEKQPWRDEWTPPPTKAEKRTRSNIDAAAEAKRRIFGETA